ncbi:hypothetical protein BDY19DRAFT_903615 [Irpex rosettiformis]|uniref:Uncharacterized protein n=1 Tax=Irpex rosettiformis TaxID=378272 RepID=A0ACB8UEV1_9APHY|nr:hypothetical protein BDY19DRAFT_903615 [Irpex rosettiformis]
MSDLDADLYGGEWLYLYGNDEAEYTEQLEAPPKETAEPATAKRETPAPPPAATSTATKPPTAAPTKSEPEPSHVEDEVHDLQSLDAAHDSAAYEDQTTQQIPTYQERQEPEYQNTPAQHLDGSNFGVNRPVRPSEMKEEGILLYGSLDSSIAVVDRRLL